MNAGTPQGGGITRVGDRCFLLAYSHVAHDNTLGDGVVLANNVMLAGHCKIGDHVIVGGGAGLHQFVRVGSYAFIGGMSAIENDVIPYGMAMGNRAALAGLNIIGLKRRGFSRTHPRPASRRATACSCRRNVGHAGRAHRRRRGNLRRPSPGRRDPSPSVRCRAGAAR